MTSAALEPLAKPATAEPATVEPAAAKTATAEQTTADPAAKPATAEPATAEPAVKSDEPAAKPDEPATSSPPALTAPTAEDEAEPSRPAAEDNAANILPASYWQQQAEGEAESENSSAYADSITSSTASLSASILEYRTLHGRTYHSERGGGAQSWNPNDAQHEEDGKLYLADLGDNVGKVLDVGCGTGIWAIDFADQHPEAEVIGLDISPQQPQWTPPNLRFEVDDVMLEWTYPPNSFDYIHMRWLVGSIADWDQLYREIFRATKPGGIFEHKESSCVIQSDDDTVHPETALAQWGMVFQQAGKKFGRTFSVYEEDIQVRAMKAAGFEDVQVRNFKVPVGSWPADEKMKDVGKYAQLAIQRDVEGFVNFMWSSVMGWSTEEIHVYAAHLRKELKAGHYHAWYPMRVVIGRKPFDAHSS